MIDKTLLDNLNDKDKESLKWTLENLISQTYSVESEYKKLNLSYQNLQGFLNQIVEALPNALWVLNEDESIYLQNSEAKKVSNLIKRIDLQNSSSEIEYKRKIYLVKTKQIDNKTIISATDITEQKRGERLASMGQIAAHLSHEIRNPIGAISLLSSTLIQKVKPDNKQIVKEIQKSIYRVERIIKSTLLFTKGVEISKETFSLDELKEQIKEAKNYYSTTKEIKLNIEFAKKDIYADFDLLSMVMQNFLYNAIDAIEEEDEKESGVVTFIYQDEKTDDIFIIKDSGAKIKNKNILFEPFQTTKTKGHGLGLALSLEIIKAHGGKISLLKDEKGFKISIKKWKKI